MNSNQHIKLKGHKFILRYLNHVVDVFILTDRYHYIGFLTNTNKSTPLSVVKKMLTTEQFGISEQFKTNKGARK